MTNKETLLGASDFNMSHERMEMRNPINTYHPPKYVTDTVTPKEQNEEKDSDARHNRVNQVFFIFNKYIFKWQKILNVVLASSYSIYDELDIFLRCENYL